jgi:Tol biopolymer transport system component
MRTIRDSCGRRAWLVLMAGLLAAAGLTVLGVEPAGATFPPGVNGKLAFAGSAGGADDDVYTANANGSGLQQLVDGGDDRETIWSPDGTKIAYVNDDDGDDEIWVRNADGSGSATRLTDNGSNDRHPNWSPDGTRIAYTSTAGGDQEIRVMNASDGSDTEDLTDNTVDDRQPNWRPDGARIAFASDRGRGGDLDIWVMDADGSDADQITNSTGEDNMPSWSPNGTKIAFVTRRGGNYDVWVMDADGTDAGQLTTDPADDRDPAWSPDGTKIAFDSDREGPQRVFLMDADGTDEAAVPSGLQESRTPEWQRLTSAPPLPQPECADGQDNDGDGKTDLADPGCENANDNTESSDAAAPPPSPPFQPVALQKIQKVRVYPHGQYVTVVFRTQLATKKVRAELWKGTKGAAGAQLKRFQIKTSPTAKRTWIVKLINLTARTRYDQLWIYSSPLGATTGAEYKHPTAVKTKQRNIVVFFGNIHIIDDSDSDSCGDFNDDGGGFDFQLGTVETQALLLQKQIKREAEACDGDDFNAGVALILKNVKHDQLLIFVRACDDDGLIADADCAHRTRVIDLAPTGFTPVGENRKGSASILTNEGDSDPRTRVSMGYGVSYGTW